MSLLAARAGAFTTVQDQGRPGLTPMGVGRAGAFDRVSAHQGNALVGNDDDAAVLEVVGGGLELEATEHHVVAVTGAAAEVRIDGRVRDQGRALVLLAGQRLTIGRVTHGLRLYVAVAGGVETPVVLGSRSADTLAGLGGERLVDGVDLPVGHPAGEPSGLVVPWLGRTGEVQVDVVLGPRDDWFTTESVRRLLETSWTVTPDCDRIGMRLDGPRLERRRTDELASEPCVRGGIQVPPSGRPVVFGPDHPVTGGYPIVAVVLDAHTDRLAQVAPGDRVRFRRVTR